MVSKTNKISILILFLGFLTGTVVAQPNRTFDNFDTRQGVQVVRPAAVTRPAPAEPAVTRNNRQEARRNGPTMSAGDGYAVQTSAVYANINMSAGRTLRGYTTGDSKIDSYIVESSSRYNIDPLLIYAQMHQESAFKLRATSHKGASGLMQLMPATARRFGVTQIYDPRQNIDAGVKYMRWLLDKFNGDVTLALAGYNAGEGAVMKYGWQVPPYRETREYVRRISARYAAIGNGSIVQPSRPVTREEVARLEEKETTTPLSIYEPNTLTVRLPDGSIRLITQ